LVEIEHPMDASASRSAVLRFDGRDGRPPRGVVSRGSEPGFSGDVAELLSLGERLQLLERLILDLPDPLARDVEGPPDLVKRPRVLAAKSVPQLQHSPLPIGEILERLAQGLLGEDLGGALIRGLSALVGDELAELRLLFVA